MTYQGWPPMPPTPWEDRMDRLLESALGRAAQRFCANYWRRVLLFAACYAVAVACFDGAAWPPPDAVMMNIALWTSLAGRNRRQWIVGLYFSYFATTVSLDIYFQNPAADVLARMILCVMFIGLGSFAVYRYRK